MSDRYDILRSALEQFYLKLNKVPNAVNKLWTQEAWWRAFVRLFVKNNSDDYHQDDLLFFVYVKGKSPNGAPFALRRKTSTELPDEFCLHGSNFNNISWSNTTLLNIVLQSSYQLTAVSCRKSDLVEVAKGNFSGPNVTCIAKQVYASPSKSPVNVGGESKCRFAEPEPSYPSVCFAIDTFEEDFQDLIMGDEDSCYCLVLQAMASSRVLVSTEGGDVRPRTAGRVGSGSHSGSHSGSVDGSESGIGSNFGSGIDHGLSRHHRATVGDRGPTVPHPLEGDGDWAQSSTTAAAKDAGRAGRDGSRAGGGSRSHPLSNASGDRKASLPRGSKGNNDEEVFSGDEADDDLSVAAGDDDIRSRSDEEGGQRVTRMGRPRQQQQHRRDRRREFSADDDEPLCSADVAGKAPSRKGIVDLDDGDGDDDAVGRGGGGGGGGVGTEIAKPRVDSDCEDYDGGGYNNGGGGYNGSSGSGVPRNPYPHRLTQEGIQVNTVTLFSAFVDYKVVRQQMDLGLRAQEERERRQPLTRLVRGLGSLFSGSKFAESSAGFGSSKPTFVKKLQMTGPGGVGVAEVAVSILEDDRSVEWDDDSTNPRHDGGPSGTAYCRNSPNGYGRSTVGDRAEARREGHRYNNRLLPSSGAAAASASASGQRMERDRGAGRGRGGGSGGGVAGKGKGTGVLGAGTGEFASSEAVSAAARALGLDLYDEDERAAGRSTSAARSGQPGRRRPAGLGKDDDYDDDDDGRPVQMYNCAIMSLSMEVDILALSVLELLLL